MRLTAVLTPLGWGTLAGAVVLYVAGFALGYPEPVVLATGALLALAAAVAWTAPRPRLEVHREVTPLKVPRGEAAVAVLSVTNLGSRGLSGLRAQDRLGSAEHTVDLPRLPKGAARTVSYPLPTDARGEIPVGPLVLVRADPFGLTRRVREYGRPATLLVRPRTVALPVPPSGKAHHLEGPTSDNAPAGTVTFHTLREYVVGDDLRHVHWRSSARTGTLMVRQLIDASLPTTTVLLDTRGLTEVAVDAAASAAVAAARAGFPVRVLTGDGPLPDPKPDAETVLDRLALVRPGTAGVTEALRMARGGGALVLVTGDPSEVGRAAGVRRRFDRVLCVYTGSGPAPAGPAGVTVVPIAALDELPVAWGAR
ncbi:DUF58 domain-containing protein [Nonomuraea gerenzanensis]|uniref:DUF58 domain-containing protein n=1 Tax=Nonomuraea gerenzanensis TaxID=93944 RepID=A0A1M4EJ19_9ACTN|nr:DUF58 domain-containing protein [Nonomuraea gerenzanensis]UBU10495.1 DUF58 domain-containing protein [Nonomuraea gerenzanensis]SBO98899.1 FIG002343: hypothetical protein [Nonomuraea gerenzanensis]